MTKNNPKHLNGIDEIDIFQRLWSKRVFIIIVTTLCVIVGLISITQRSPMYTVTLNLRFTGANNNHMNCLFQYGKLDFTNYKKTGKIEKNDSLKFTNSEKSLLIQLKNTITFEIDYPNGRISIIENTTDTLSATQRLKTLGKVLQPKLVQLQEACFTRLKDSLQTEIDQYRLSLKKQLKGLIELQDKYKNSSDIEKNIEIKLAETEFSTAYQFTEIKEISKKQ